VDIDTKFKDGKGLMIFENEEAAYKGDWRKN